MDSIFLLRGLIIGFSIAAPVGPIGVLCIKRTLAEGRVVGLLSGLGAATADAVYGCVAALGLTVASDFLVAQNVWLRLFGGAFLCYLGVRTFLSKPSEPAPSAKVSGLLGSYVSTFLLTLSNPMTILSFVAIFAGLGVGETGGNVASALELILGVFAGSSLWWFVLSWLVSLFRRRLNQGRLRWVNRVSGIVIAAFGVIVLLSLKG